MHNPNIPDDTLDNRAEVLGYNIECQFVGTPPGHIRLFITEDQPDSAAQPGQVSLDLRQTWLLMQFLYDRRDEIRRAAEQEHQRAVAEKNAEQE